MDKKCKKYKKSIKSFFTLFFCILVPNQSFLIEWKETKLFIPPVKGGQVIKVYDGDTITIATYLPPFSFPNDAPLYRFRVRLAEIDAPELNGPTQKEQQLAKLSQQALEKIILHEYVFLKNVNMEKYGRLLATVEWNGININKWMVENEFATNFLKKSLQKSVSKVRKKFTKKCFKG